MPSEGLDYPPINEVVRSPWGCLRRDPVTGGLIVTMQCAAGNPAHSADFCRENGGVLEPPHHLDVLGGHRATTSAQQIFTHWLDHFQGPPMKCLVSTWVAVGTKQVQDVCVNLECFTFGALRALTLMPTGSR